MGGIEEKIRVAQDAEGEELWKAIRLLHPDVLFNATLNRNLGEKMALFIAKSRSAPAEALGALAGDVRFRDSYKLKLAICKNPRSPQRVALGLLKYLRIFDMADLTRNRHIPAMLRQKVEFLLGEKIPSLPSGIKTALARRACGSIVVRLMERGDRRVIDSCLQSPVLIEEHLCRLINAQLTKPLVIRAIAEHPKWSLRYPVRFALIRNPHTPMVCVDAFLDAMKTSDLQCLYEDPKLPPVTKPFVFRELGSRDEPLQPREEETYILSEDEIDDASLDDT